MVIPSSSSLTMFVVNIAKEQKMDAKIQGSVHLESAIYHLHNRASAPEESIAQPGVCVYLFIPSVISIREVSCKLDSKDEDLLFG